MLSAGYDVPVTVPLRLRGIIDVWRYPLLSRHTPVATEFDPTGLVTITSVIDAVGAASRRRAGSGNETRPTKILDYSVIDAPRAVHTGRAASAGLSIQPNGKAGRAAAGIAKGQRGQVKAARPLTTGSDRGEKLSRKTPGSISFNEAHEQMCL
jgi:hypothetical protein